MHILAVWSRPEHAKGKGAIPTALAAEGPDLPFSLCPPPIRNVQGLEGGTSGEQMRVPGSGGAQTVRTSLWMPLVGSHIE